MSEDKTSIEITQKMISELPMPTVETLRNFSVLSDSIVEQGGDFDSRPISKAIQGLSREQLYLFKGYLDDLWVSAELTKPENDSLSCTCEWLDAEVRYSIQIIPKTKPSFEQLADQALIEYQSKSKLERESDIDTIKDVIKNELLEQMRNSGKTEITIDLSRLGFNQISDGLLDKLKADCIFFSWCQPPKYAFTYVKPQ